MQENSTQPTWEGKILLLRGREKSYAKAVLADEHLTFSSITNKQPDIVIKVNDPNTKISLDIVNAWVRLTLINALYLASVQTAQNTPIRFIVVGKLNFINQAATTDLLKKLFVVKQQDPNILEAKIHADAISQMRIFIIFAVFASLFMWLVTGKFGLMQIGAISTVAVFTFGELLRIITKRMQ